MSQPKRYLLPVAPRRSVVESLSHQRLDHPVRLHVAHPDDSPLLAEYFSNVFGAESQLFGSQPDEAAKLYGKAMEKATADGLTLILSDCFEVFGGFVCQRRVVDEFAVNENSHEQSVYDLAGRRVGEFLPADVKEYAFGGLLFVDPKLRRCGFGKRLVAEMLKLCTAKEIRYLVVSCFGGASTSLLKSFGFREAFAFPCTEFKAPGDSQLLNNSPECNVLVADLNSVQIAESPLSPLPYRVEGKREVVDLGFFAKRLGRSLRVVVATMDDAAAVRKFIRNEFYRQAPVAQTLQIPREDVDLLADVYNINILSENLSLLALDGDRICGLLTNHVLKSVRKPLEIGIPADYAKLASEVAYYSKATRRAQIRGSFFHYFYTRRDHLLPPDCTEYLVNNILSVHPDYRGCGIADKLWTESLRLGKRRGIRYATANCTAIGSTRVAEKAGMHKALIVPFELFLYEGKPALRENRVYDGGKAAAIMTVDLATIHSDIPLKV